MKEGPLLFWLTFFALAGANASPKIALLSSEHDALLPFAPQDSLEVVHKTVPRTVDPLLIRKAVCDAVDEGVSGVIDATSDGGLVSQTVRSVCDSVHVPCVSVSPHGRHDNVFSVKLHPSRDYVAQVLRDVLHSMAWTSVTFVYDTLDNLALAQDFLDDSDFTVKVARVANNSDVSRVLEGIESTGATSVIIALTPHHLQKLLKAAPVGGTGSPSQKWLVASLDAPLAALEAFSLASASRLAVLRMADEATFQRDDSLQLQQLLVNDALRTFGRALRPSATQPPTGLCQSSSTWGEGEDLLTTLKQIQLLGSTGPVSFSPAGERAQTHFGLLQLVGGQPHSLLTWTPTAGVALSHWAQQVRANKVKRQAGPTLRVHAILSDPYVMYKQSSDPNAPMAGRAALEGLCVDILDEVAAELGFDYTIDLVEGNTYGSRDVNSGQWSGLIGSIVNRRADVIIGDVTVSRQREAVVSFTKPWLTFGVGLIASRGNWDHSPYLFGFLDPFQLELWITLLLVYLAVSFLFFLVARLSPIERTRPAKEETESWSPYTLLHSGWFVVSAMLRQTPVQQPRSLSVRVLSGFWWFFTLIVTAYYIAALVHFITTNVSMYDEPIESVYDLVNQHKIKYGAVPEGTTWRYFKNSQMPIHQQIYAGLENSRASMYKPASQKEGVEMVESSEGQYAFFLEQPTLEYMTQRRCDLKSIGGTMGPMRNFAIGLVKGSPYLQRFNDAILSLRESGVLQVLYDKWVKEERGGGACDDIEEDSTPLANALGLEDLAGPLIVLAIGVGVAFVIAICECCCRAAFIAKQRGDPLCGEVASQLKLAVKGPPPVSPSIVVNPSA